MDPRQLDILTRLDTELPVADAELKRLDERLRSLVDEERRSELGSGSAATVTARTEPCGICE